MGAAAALLGWLANGGAGPAPVTSMLVGAHPDDETIGAGGHLAELRPLVVVCVTDGAPRRLSDAAALAARRRRELAAALRAGGLEASALRPLDVPDQAAISHVGEIAGALRRLIAALRPDLVLTHAYEGGHPDHDATALAVHLAVQGTERRPEIVEFAGYNVAGAGCFLPGGDPVVECALNPVRRERKARMTACHVSQAQVLAGFPVDIERFRLAPRYGFGAPPHAGALHYEAFDWGVDGAAWRALARAALAAAT